MHLKSNIGGWDSGWPFGLRGSVVNRTFNWGFLRILTLDRAEIKNKSRYLCDLNSGWAAWPGKFSVPRTAGAKFLSVERFSWKWWIFSLDGLWCKENQWKLNKIVCWRTSVVYMTRRAACILRVISVSGSAGRPCGPNLVITKRAFNRGFLWIPTSDLDGKLPAAR